MDAVQGLGLGVEVDLPGVVQCHKGQGGHVPDVVEVLVGQENGLNTALLLGTQSAG